MLLALGYWLLALLVLLAWPPLFVAGLALYGLIAALLFTWLFARGFKKLDRHFAAWWDKNIIGFYRSRVSRHKSTD